MAIAKPLSHKYLDSLHVLYLFTKSDFKTTIFPVTLFAIVAAPLASASHFYHAVFWIWMHILHFDVANQYLNPSEDKMNKKDRPLPSGRISPENAKILRWALLPACLALSASYGPLVLNTSIVFAVLTILYNELHAHTWHWFIRNIINASGMALFEIGATLIASKDRHRLDYNAMLAVAITAGIYATTYQAADFKDVIGDKLVGRKTLPIVWPAIARPTVFLGLVLWSMGNIAIWRLDIITAMVFLTFSTYVGSRYLMLSDIREDQVSFYLYNLWLSCVYAFPGYYRLLSA